MKKALALVAILGIAPAFVSADDQFRIAEEFEIEVMKHHGKKHKHHKKHGKKGNIAQKMGAKDGKKMGAKLAFAPFKMKKPKRMGAWLKKNGYPKDYIKSFFVHGKIAYKFVMKHKVAFHGGFKGYRFGCYDSRKGNQHDASVHSKKLHAVKMPGMFIKGFEKGYAKGFKRCAKRAKKPNMNSEVELLDELNVEEFMMEIQDDA